ncbi:MAG: gamma-glutamyltransferase [bacterium]|nr:gamma-glutamyltransferase [bacterium]
MRTMISLIKKDRNRRKNLILSAVLLSLFFLPGCDAIKISEVYEKGAVASASPIATEIGLNVLKSGGNAVDAAVAVGFALAVVHPEAGNIGGGGFALVRAGQEPEIRALDFREKAPAAATEQMYLDDSGAVIDQMSTVGANSAGVPGTVAGLYALWQEYGSIEWDALVAPAAELADSGFIVDDYFHQSLSRYRERLNQFEETSRLFFPNGSTPLVGEKFVQSDLAGTLYLVASEGRDGFYTGSNAKLIIAAMERHGGLIDSSDLAGYSTTWRSPVHFEFDGLDIYSMPPPSSGGIVMGQILKLLEPSDFSASSFGSAEFIHLFAEACRVAYADRAEHLGDPDFYNIPDNLLDETYLTHRRGLIDHEYAVSSETIKAGSIGGAESTETTHYSVVDENGNMASITYTINSSYGSKLVVDGGGYLLNNEMDDFSAKPGVPNLYGLVGSETNKIEPGKRMLSSMAPTLVLKNDEPYLTFGSKGGSQIISALAAVLLGLERFGLDPHEALATGRFHHQWLPDQLLLEEGAFDITVVQDLIRRGHDLVQEDVYSEIHLIRIKDGTMLPVCDPRSRGNGDGGF